MSITVNFNQVKQLLEIFGGEEAEITLAYGPGHSGDGLYAYHTDYPEEGSFFLEE